MQKVATREYVKVVKSEYTRLKQLEKRFGNFLRYAQHVKDIDAARKSFKKYGAIPQEEVFKKFGF